MSRTQVRGNVQIQTTTITNDQIASDAAIATSKLAEGAELIKRDGSVAFTGTVDVGANKVTNLGAPVNPTDAVRKTDLDNATDGFVVTNEVPSGVLDAVNTVFTTANTPNSGTVQVFVNGTLQKEGASDDYTVSGSTITMNYAPNSSDVVLVSYISDGVILGTSTVDVNQISGTLAISKGGTGASTAQGAINALTQVSTATDGQVLTRNSSGNAVWQAGGVLSVNGLTTTAQSLAVGTSGTDVNISSSGSIHTINIPTASATARGLVSYSPQTFGGNKIFVSNLAVGSPPSITGTLTVYNPLKPEIRMGNSTSGVSTTRGAGMFLDSSGNMTIHNSENGYMAFSTNNVEQMRIASTGQVLIGYTSSNGNYQLQVNGQIYATSATIATSDVSFKENINPLNDCLAFVNKLNPVSFTWKQNNRHNFNSGTQVGFIAQEVQTAFSSSDYVAALVKENKSQLENGEVESFLGLAKEDLIPFLVGALKQLHKDYLALEKELSLALKSN